jgi:DNA-binding MarR family transcriptional regulator
MMDLHQLESSVAKSNSSAPQTLAWALLLSVSSRLLERIEASLAAADLPPLAWYDVLWELEKARDGRLRMHEIADHTVLSRSNLTRLADRLENAGLIEREICADDRRGAYCVITRAGRQMRARMWPMYQKGIEELFAAHVGADEAKSMSTALQRVLQAVNGD